MTSPRHCERERAACILNCQPLRGFEPSRTNSWLPVGAVEWHPGAVRIIRAIRSVRTPDAVRVVDAVWRIGTAISAVWVGYAIRIVWVSVHVAPEVSLAVIEVGACRAGAVRIRKRPRGLRRRRREERVRRVVPHVLGVRTTR